MARFFRWLTQRRNGVTSIQHVAEIDIERSKMKLADVIKIVIASASLIWAVAAAAAKVGVHDQRLDDHESRLRVVERMAPQVEAMYTVIVERKRPNERRNPR